MPPLRISENSFNKRHLRLNRKLLDFSTTKRGRNIVTAQIKDNLQLASASSLKAINCAARICLAQHLVERLCEMIAKRAVTQIMFVTLVLKEHTVPLQLAADFDVKVCESVTKSFLESFDYIGFVEPAFYYSAPFAGEPTRPFVSWHSHAIVWTEKSTELVSRQRLFNRTYSAFLPEWRSAHCKAILQWQLPSYTRYMSKNVLKECTAYPKKQEFVDLQTGEIITRPSGKWKNRKRDIRPTNLVRAMSAVGDRTLKQLSFAGGAGKSLRTEALNATRQSLSQQSTARAVERAKLLFGIEVN